jgi:hypothetical protein
MTVSAQLEIYRRRAIELVGELQLAAMTGDWPAINAKTGQIQEIAKRANMLTRYRCPRCNMCRDACRSLEPHLSRLDCCLPPESPTATAEVMPMGEDRESESV